MIKNIWGTSQKWRGKKWKRSSFVSCKGSMSLLNMILICYSCRVRDILTWSLSFLGLGNQFCLSSDHANLSSWPLILCWIKCCQTLKSCHQYVQEKSYRQLFSTYTLSDFMLHPWIVLVHSTTSFVSCRWCEIHYVPPSTDPFPSVRVNICILPSVIKTPLLYHLRVPFWNLCHST